MAARRTSSGQIVVDAADSPDRRSESGLPSPDFRFSEARPDLFLIIRNTPVFDSSNRKAGLDRHYAVFCRDDRLRRRGREAIVDPEITRREVIARIISGEYKNISFIHEVADSLVEDVTADLLAEATLPDIGLTGADLQASEFDHVRDLRKHEPV